MKVYGPYTNKDGRARCILVHEDGRKQTVSYPRMLMEAHLGRSLLPEEDVHHLDEDVSNNDIGNLEVRVHSEHCREHSIKYMGPAEVTCTYCGVEFTLTPLQQRSRFGNRSRKLGPFCSRKCSGKYGTDVQRAAKQECLG